MKNLNGWQATAALGIIVAGIVVVIVTHHAGDLPLAAKVIGWIVSGGALTFLRLYKQCPSPSIPVTIADKDSDTKPD